MGGTAVVHVAQRDDVLPGDTVEIGLTPVDNADDPDVELLVGGVGARAPGGEDRENALLDESASGDSVANLVRAKLRA